MAALLPAPVLVIASSTDLDLSKTQTVLQQLGYQPDMLLYADNLQSAQEMIAEHLPNLILYLLTEASQIHFIGQMKRHTPSTPVVAVLKSESTALIYSAILSGANSYIQPQASFIQFAESLKTVLRGGAYIHAELAEHILYQLTGKPCLKVTELQLLRLLSQQKPPVDIQHQLQLTDYQMYAQVKQIYRKMLISSD
ncbi:DNA-binding response regulator [Acinetobacter sp. 18QD2AZ41W]|uniref:DNA-binding response regulator n=1 Tax=Acinetobacter sp. 18QD2AZ41W TaxID=2692137 RepID=UPI0013596441|nr:DNA-binding response regulator [Acinetobacter sp. 18QD2AZ41W]HJE54509.1 DNA-binding response regulator [Acinetobacter pseudolwoffii]